MNSYLFRSRKYLKTPEGQCRLNNDRIRKILRRIEVLQLSFNDIFGMVVLPTTEVFYVALIVAGAWGSVRMPSLYKTFWMLAGIWNFWAFSKMYKGMGMMYDTSGLLLRDLRARRMGNDRVMGRFLRSCRTLRVAHRWFFYVDKLFILTFWRIIFDSTVSLLVATK